MRQHCLLGIILFKGRINTNKKSPDRLSIRPFQVFLGTIGIMIRGGAEGDRTPDLMAASHALSQLSYSPTKE